MRSKRFYFALALASAQLGVVGYLDYLTSYEVSVAVLYYFPIAYAAWFLGWGWSFCFGLLCAATLTWADIYSGHKYSKEWMIWEVTGIRVIGFSFVAFSFNFFKRTLDREREKVRRLEGLMTFCNCCNQVQDEHGNWSDLRTLVLENSTMQTRLKVCPSCARAAYAGVGRSSAEIRD